MEGWSRNGLPAEGYSVGKETVPSTSVFLRRTTSNWKKWYFTGSAEAVCSPCTESLEVWLPLSSSKRCPHM